MKRPAPFLIKADVSNVRAKRFSFDRQRTMYGGKKIAAGDEIFLFASENEGGAGLFARGIVTLARAHAKPRGVARWTPRVSIEVERMALAKRPLGREHLRAYRNKDGSPQAELDFKFYRQATNKIGGVSAEAAEFLQGFF